MKTFPRLLVIATALSLTMIGCSKDDSDSNSTPAATKTQLLTAHAWILTGATLNGVDYYSSLDACDLDNTLTFRTDFTYVDDEGATRCDTANPQTTTGTWAFANNETELTLDAGSPDAQTAQINTLNATTLTVAVSDSLFNIVMTYSKP